MAKLVLFVVFSVLCFCDTDGLKCLQCLDYAPGGSCMHDYMGLVNTSLQIFPNNSKPYYKECPDGTNSLGVKQEFCAIEVFYVGGELKSFIRDCSDGKNFSFTDTVKNAKLTQLTADNFTTCIYLLSANAHICVSLCDSENFCNAPRPPLNDTEDICNDTDLDGNATCGAGGFFTGSGPFGPVVDRFFGRAYLLPLMVAILCVSIFG